MSVPSPGEIGALAMVAQLRATLGTMEIALGAIADGIAWTDEEGRIRWCNASFSALVGRARIGLLGARLAEALPLHPLSSPDSQSLPPLGELMAAAPAGSGTWELGEEGERRVVEVSWSQVPVAHSEASMVLVFHDVTERLRTELALRRQSGFVDLLKQVAVAANEAQNLTEGASRVLQVVCEAMQWEVGHLYFISREEPCGDEQKEEVLCSSVWYVEEPERFRPFRERTELMNFAPGVGLPGMVAASGQPEWIRDVTTHPNFPRGAVAREVGLKGGFAFPVMTGARAVAVLEFFSTRYAVADLALLEVMRQVGTQLGRVVERVRAEEDLKALADRLKRSNDELERFASVASHDLQEPLRKIQTFGERLESAAGDGLDEKARDYLTRMMAAAGRMRTLINDLLTFSRVTMRPQPFLLVDLNEVVRGVLSDLEARIEETGATIDVGPLPRIAADPLQMRQLLQNLIANALKFHRPDVAPRIEIAAQSHLTPATGARPAALWWRLDVRDNGIGFDEKYLDRIFEVFQRLHGRVEYEGSGVGLAVCRRIAERHGGSITAHSRPGEGSTFSVTLPAAQKIQEIKPATD